MGISIWQLLIILVIVLLLFGTKRLKSIGSDLGGAVKGFRNSMGGENKEEEKETETETVDLDKQLPKDEGDRVIDGEVTKKQDSDKVSR